MGPLKGQAVGLKCDAPGCGWSDMTIPRSEYPEYRNAPCPACGSNILTDADWKTLRRLERLVAVINVLFFWMKPPKEDEPHYETTVDLHGDGKGNIKTVKRSGA